MAGRSRSKTTVSAAESGARWEARAASWLERRGLKLVAKNFLCRLGEIDLIMAEAGTLVFVEVRYRADSRFGSGAESIIRSKQLRISRAAGMFLVSNPALSDRPCRFDVISIQQGPGQTRFNWIRNAFDSLI